MKKLTKTSWKRTLSILMCFLVVSMTPAYAQALASSTGSGTSSPVLTNSTSLFVNASLPKVVPEQRIEIQGKSLAGAKITLLVNEVVTRAGLANAEGVFVFSGIALLPGINTILLDSELNGQHARQQENIEVDIVPPNISINLPSIAVRSPLEINVSTSKPVTVHYSVQGPGMSAIEKTLSAKGNFILPLDLAQGKNSVRVVVSDSAGHEFERVTEIVYDTLPPQFIQEELNLKDLSPTYTSDITVRGRVSEPATVFAFLNDAATPSARALTKSDGSFELSLTLRRDLQASLEKKRVSLETGQSSINKVRLEAVDAAGLRTVLPPVPVTYAVCGQGSAYRVELGQPIPDLLNPRLLLEGLQQVGFTVKIDYAGGLQAKLNPDTGISLRSLTLSPEVAKEYDNGLVQSGHIQLKPTSNTSSVGYATLLLQAPFLDSNENNQTVYDQELNLSEHRKGDCLLPGFGCMRFFLELELAYQEKIPNKVLDPNTRTTLSKFSTNKRVQKVCVPIEVAIDKRVPLSILPKGLLTSTVEFLGNAVEAIDTVLKPLTTLGTYILYACLAGMVLVYASYVRERMSCDFSSTLQSAFLLEPWNKEVAETGLCDTVYEGKETQRTACNTCSNAVLARKNLENKFFHMTCDRISCPSAPSLMSHIRNNQVELTPLPVSEAVANKILQKHPELKGVSDNVNEKLKTQYGGKTVIFSGSDCAFGIAKNYGEKNNPLTISGQYYLLKNNKKPATIDCDGLHPATPACCAYEYQQEWGTSCGFSKSNTDTFSEIKESTCLASQKTPQGVKKFESDFGESCNRLWNAAAGFCEPNTGEPAPEVIATGYQYPDTMAKVLGTAKTRDVFVQVRPILKPGTKEVMRYDISRGYVHDRYVYERTTSASTNSQDQEIFKQTKQNYNKDDSTRWHLNNRLDFFQEKPFDAKLFDAGLEDLPKGKTKEKSDTLTQTTKIKQFSEALCSGLKDEINCKKDTVVLREIYNKVYSLVGVADQEYIVDPKSGFLRSMQCACIPAVTSYLELWRNILNWGKSCFTSILVTGDGSSGACRAGLSMYVCDLLYELISCAASKYSSPGINGRIGTSGIGNFFGAVTSAGSDVSSRVRARYGDSTLYNSLFVQRKLIHSACAFAFTGAWDLDVEALFKQSVQDVPIESQGYLTKCERRFQGFDPSSDPSGSATWTYRFGSLLFAGAPLRYDLKLVCSNGPKCSEADGFKNGMCDCPKGEKSISLYDADLNGVLSKNGVLDKEIIYTVGAGGDPNDDVRYDRLVMSWEAEDPVTHKILSSKAECKLSQAGAEPPAFCSFDPFSFSYRCAFAFGGEGAKISKASPVLPEKREVLTDKTNCRKTYVLGDSPSFTLIVRQQVKEDARKTFQSQKFLRTVIKNSEGQIIYSLPEDKEGPYEDNAILFKQGEYEVPVKLSQFIIDKTHFSNKALPHSTQLFVRKGAIVEQDQSLFSITRESITSADGSVVGSARLLFRFNTIDQSTVQMNVYQALTDPPSFSYGQQLYSATLDWPIGSKNLALTDLDLVSQDKNTHVKIKQLVINRVPTPGTLMEVYLFVPQQISTPQACDPNKVETWKAEFTLFDADKFGTPSSQVAVNPATGDLAVLEVPFNSMCVDLVKDTGKVGECSGTSSLPVSATPAKTVLPEFLVTVAPLKVSSTNERVSSITISNSGKIDSSNTRVELIAGRGVKKAYFVGVGNPTTINLGVLLAGKSTSQIDILLEPVDNIKQGEPLVVEVIVSGSDATQQFKTVFAYDPVHEVPATVSSTLVSTTFVTAPGSVISGTTQPVTPLIVGSICGNGIVEEGEMCDNSGSQIIVPTTDKNPGYSISYGFSDTLGKNVLVLFDHKNNEVITSVDPAQVCAKLTNECTQASLALSAGRCSSDCKDYRPLFTCKKPEPTLRIPFFSPTPGFSNWYGPGFTAGDKTVVVDLPQNFFYVGSDTKPGNDKCLGGSTRSPGVEVIIS